MATAIKSKPELYVTRVPLILAALAGFTFVSAFLALGAWNRSLLQIALLGALSIEMYLLPYVLIPAAVRLPTCLPWVRYNVGDEFGIDGNNRLRQRVLVGCLLILPGLATLGAFGSIGTDMPWYLYLALTLWHGAQVPLLVFAALTLILTLPDLSSAQTEN